MLVVFTCLFMLVPAALMAGGFWLLGGWGLLAGLGIALLVVLAITLVFLRHGIFRKTPRQAGDTLSPGPGEKRTTAGLARQQRLRNKLLAHGRENLWITSYDGLRLYGVFVPGAPGEKRVMMILHGYGGNALQMAEYALYFREHYGFNILLPDMRCHGQSDGRYLGMGWLERKDCLQWLALLEKKLGPGVQAALYGVSMGGATVMMLAGEALPPWVKFMVEDCGYTSVHDQFAFQVKSIYHLPPFPIVPLGSLLCRALAGYGFWEASAVKQLQKATLPMVFVHGQADTFVPYAMLQTVFEQAACQNKVRIAIPGATHAQAFPMDTVGKIKKEIDRYIRLYM